MPSEVNAFLFSFVVHFALDLAILFNVVLVGIVMEMWSEVEFVLLISRFPFVTPPFKQKIAVLLEMEKIVVIATF